MRLKGDSIRLDSFSGANRCDWLQLKSSSIRFDTLELLVDVIGRCGLVGYTSHAVYQVSQIYGDTHIIYKIGCFTT